MKKNEYIMRVVIRLKVLIRPENGKQAWEVVSSDIVLIISRTESFFILLLFLIVTILGP